MPSLSTPFLAVVSSWPSASTASRTERPEVPPSASRTWSSGRVALPSAPHWASGSELTPSRWGADAVDRAAGEQSGPAGWVDPQHPCARLVVDDDVSAVRRGVHQRAAAATVSHRCPYEPDGRIGAAGRGDEGAQYALAIDRQHAVGGQHHDRPVRPDGHARHRRERSATCRARVGDGLAGVIGLPG